MNSKRGCWSCSRYSSVPPCEQAQRIKHLLSTGTLRTLLPPLLYIIHCVFLKPAFGQCVNERKPPAPLIALHAGSNLLNRRFPQGECTRSLEAFINPSAARSMFKLDPNLLHCRRKEELKMRPAKEPQRNSEHRTREMSNNARQCGKWFCYSGKSVSNVGRLVFRSQRGHQSNNNRIASHFKAKNTSKQQT